MLLTENDKITEIKFIDCWDYTFCNYFVDCHNNYFRNLNDLIYPKNENIKIYQYKGRLCPYTFSTEKCYSPNYILKYKDIPCMEIESLVFSSSTHYNIKYNLLKNIPIYDVILNLKLPDVIKIIICQYVK